MRTSGISIEQTIPIQSMSSAESTAELKTYKGKCHCGKFAFEYQIAEEGNNKPYDCNCSLCRIRAYLLVYARGAVDYHVSV